MSNMTPSVELAFEYLELGRSEKTVIEACKAINHGTNRRTYCSQEL